MRKRGARKKLALFAAGGASASILAAPKCSRALFLAPWAGLGDSPGAPGTLPGRCRDDPRTIPEHVENAPDGPWELLGRQGVPGRLLGAILSRFWVPRGSPWKQFCAISALIFMPIFAIISSLLSVIFGDSRDFETQDETRDEA